MDLSTTANWMGVIFGLATGAAWFWKFLKWLRSILNRAEEAAALGSSIVSELLDSATTPARRADIHAFVQFRCTEIEADRTRRFFRIILTSMIVLVVGVLTAFVFRILDFKDIGWLWWFLVINSLIGFVAYASALFFEHQIKRMNSAWQATARKALGNRAVRHINKT
jgi:hypothetical protein